MAHTAVASQPRIHHFPVGHLFGRIAAFLKKNVLLSIAMMLALLTSVIVPPDAAYADYLDYKTLVCLFCTLAVICALKNIHFFTLVAERIVVKTGNLRFAIITLVYITFIGSMLIANDMALLTFLPLGYMVLTSARKEHYMAFTFIMQNIAANLGGMLTPFGNPQNLYLYSCFNIPTGEFLSIMFIPFLVSVALITICCLFVKKESVQVAQHCDEKLPVGRTAIYLALFALSIVIVFRVIPYWLGLIIIPAVLMVMDRKALRMVDYPLLLVFVCFFIFAGNMSRIPAVDHLLSALLSRNTLVVSALSCQLISNVPSAVLLSRFTDQYAALLMGVNIGGAGTLIASLASLITFREYVSHNPGKTARYIAQFSAFNFGFLIVLLGVCSLLV